ncbi:MAG: hypothetical protein ABEH78_04825 [Haloferacaceae archaeon]
MIGESVATEFETGGAEEVVEGTVETIADAVARAAEEVYEK